MKSVKRIIKSMKQKYRLNAYLDGGGKKIESICKYVAGIMALTFTEAKKCHKISEVYHKVNEAKIWVKSIHG